MVAGLMAGKCLAFNSRRKPWHLLGQSGDWDSVVEAALAAGINYPVLKGAPAVRLEDGTVIDFVNRGTVALVKPPFGDDPKHHLYGHVSANYEVLDNMDLAAMLEPLTQWGKIDTVGALGEGERVFFCFRGEAWSLFVNGYEDEQESYLVVKDQKDGTASLTFQHVGIRVVCLNTWMASEQAAKWSMPLGHQKGLQGLAEWTISTLGKLAESQKAIAKSAQLLADTQISDREADEVFKVAFALPKKPQLMELVESQDNNGGSFMNMQTADKVKEQGDKWEYDKVRMLTYQDAAYGQYHGEVANQHAAGTAWGAYQAVTGACNHWAKSRIAVRTQQTMKVAESNLFGEHAKYGQKAWDYITDGIAKKAYA